MEIFQRYFNGVLVEQWADATRIYTRWNNAGVQQEQRPYNATENQEADKRIARNTALTESVTAANSLKTVVTDLQVEKDRCDVVLAKSAASIVGQDTKDVARAAKRIADAAIDLARYVKSLN